ncbi:EndoU domain-containing protein [Granulosicoccus antarcticus]|uniref:Ribonuclease n=1 Tax=Granulosicoccus antarcticus IMCC3135 TaxID=1192854 RepID=A0A2Z2NI96_9GAMM|nr:EndoU domain-containing protein [Granulosicoccus antarcticus]ASJ71046.1 Ribonuclease [Granulosicoccus antarcticus IMCC3135]
MNKYKRYIPIVAVILLALGVNLDQFGIDLNSLSRGGSISSSTNQTQQNSNSGQSASHQKQSSAHSEPDYPKWSQTDPNVNQWHIFAGEINRSGKPVGFHSRPGGQDPASARVKSIRDKPNRAGVYTASIEIQDGAQWKGKFSSFFPDSLSRNEVLQAIVNAYANSDNPKAQPFEGPSGLGFTIQGYTSNQGGINTAFPIYVRGQ